MMLSDNITLIVRGLKCVRRLLRKYIDKTLGNAQLLATLTHITRYLCVTL